MQKDIILTSEKILDNKDFYSIFQQLGLHQYEPVLTPDKETENRYRIERSDSRKVLENSRAVSKEFKILSNKKILEIGNRLLENNENLELVSASLKNYGENIFLNFKIKDFEVDNSLEQIVGIGKVEPNITLNLPVIGGLQFIVTAVQLFCTNQVVGLSNNPLTSFVSIKHDKEIENKIDEVLLNYKNIEKHFNDILNKLSVFKEFNLSDEDYKNYLNVLFKVEDIEKNKPRLFKSLADKYVTAPNSCPGTLLGALNSVTNHIATNSYRSQELKHFSQLPTSTSYNLSKNAFKLANKLSLVGSTELLDI